MFVFGEGYRWILLGGSGIKKGWEGGGGNDASLHSAIFDAARVRGVLRCYDAIHLVLQWGVTLLVMISLRVKAEKPQKRQRFCSFVLFSFLIPVHHQYKNLPTHYREKKCAELNQAAVSVDEMSPVPTGRLVLEDAINFRFYPGILPQKG